MHWIFSVLLFFSLSVAGFAQEESSANQSETAQAEPLKILPMPDKLSPGWWAYFSVTGDELKKRTQHAENQYLVFVNKMFPEAQQSIAGQHVERFIANLVLLQDITVNDLTSQQATLDAFKTRYSIEEWLAFATHLQSEHIDLKNQLARINRERNEVKAASKRNSHRLLTYMEQGGDDTTSKLMLGLEIIEAYSVSEVKEAQLKLDTRAYDDQREQLSALLEFNKEIASRLFADNDSLVRIESLLEELSQEQTQIQRKLNLAQSETIGSLGQDLLQRAQARMKDQVVTNIFIEEAINTLKITVLKASKDLAMLLLDSEQKELDDYLEHNEKAQKLSTELASKVKEWRIDTTNEMSQVQTSIMTINADNSSNELKKIYQRRIKLTQQALASLRQFELEQDKLSLLVEEIDDRLAQKAGALGVMVNWSSKLLDSFKVDIVTWWTEPLFDIGDTPVSAFGLVRVILIIMLASALSSGFRKLLLRISERKDMEGPRAAALYTVGSLAHYLILLIGIIIALSSIGLDFTNLALVAGALSVGIGFGLQSVVNNFVSGLILLFEGTLKVGDFIEIESGVTGLVKGINVRSTLINTNDNVDIIVPNSVLVSNRVTNWTLREANRRIHVPFGVAYGTDKELVKKAVLEAAARVKYTHTFKRAESVQCWLVNFGDSSLDFELVVWINQDAVRRPGTVHAAYMWEIETSLKEYGIEIPFPQRDLHIRSSAVGSVL